MKNIRIKNIPSESIRSAIYFNVKAICGNVEKELNQMKLESIEVEDSINSIMFKIWKSDIPDPRFNNEEYITENIYNINDGDTIDFYNFATQSKIKILKNKREVCVKWKQTNV